MQPYLSIVVSSLVGDSGDRLKTFVTATMQQCRRHRIPSEVIIVEWKRPVEVAPLAETLRLPAERGPCAVRVIEVPADDQRVHPNGLEQAIAKNAGIRRARGRFVLAADVDHVLADEVMQFIAGQSQRFGSLEWQDIAVKDGSLGLGKGWFWKEMDGSKPFRWFSNDAEISIQPHSDSMRVLALDIEPGPGVNMGPTTLDVLDDAGSKVLSVRLVNRRVVNVPVPDHNGLPIRLRLHVSDTGHHASSDRRPLNARVLRCGLYEEPVTPRTWKLPQRIWWMLTRRAGSSLLPEVESSETWPESPQLRGKDDFTILSRTKWFEIRGYPEFPTGAHGTDWGLRPEDLKETQLIESERTRGVRERWARWT